MIKQIRQFLFGTPAPATNWVQDIALLAMRLILAYVFFQTSMMKWSDMEATAYWFGETLGMPFPKVNAYLAATTELVGAVLLLIGLGTRPITIPLLFVLLIALVTVHFPNGWLVVGDSAHNAEIASRLSKAKEILREYGNYEWLTAKGGFVILQNGMEFVVMYMTMLLALLGTGPGKFSIDRLLSGLRQKAK